MHFASDNAGPAHPAILDAVVAGNAGYAHGYGNDDLTQKVQGRIREIFEAPRAAVQLVATGTAANALCLGVLAEPWETIFCTAESHIVVDECNAVEAISGASLTDVASASGKMTAETLIDAAMARGGAVHHPQRGPVSITQITERGTIYSVQEITEIAEAAQTFGMPVHLDGARFANALDALGCTPAEMSWKAGVDAVSFGGTKNGCLAVEACVIFDPEKAWELELRRKRAGHLVSRHRSLSAQMDGYLNDDLWRDLARQSNGAMARLAAGLDRLGLADTFLDPPRGNMVFVRWPRRMHAALLAAGAVYYIEQGELQGPDPEEMLTGRLVCDWSLTDDAIDTFLGEVSRAAGKG